MRINKRNKGLLERLEDLYLRQKAWADDLGVLIAEVSTYDSDSDTDEVPPLQRAPDIAGPSIQQHNFDVPVRNDSRGHEF